MSISYTTTTVETFSVVHARYLASKVATDLKRFQRFYNSPTDTWIDQFEGELIELLKHDVVDNVIYGFQRNTQWTEATVRYTALPGGVLSADDDPGKIRPGLDVANASFTSFLTYNSKWMGLSSVAQAEIKVACPFQRATYAAPTLEIGYWADDLNYFTAGRGLGRSTVRR
jgi:hypothetical protein